LRLIAIAGFLSLAAYGQTPVVTKVLNAGIGDTNLAPMSVVYVYGSFVQALARNYTITVGGQTGYVSAVNSTGYLTAVIPGNAPLGRQPLVVTYQGASSDPYPVTLNAYAPEFETMSPIPVTAEGPQFPLALYTPFSHGTDLTPVTAGAPAQPGEKIVSLVSGVGQTNPPVRLGGINTFNALATNVTVAVAGTGAGVSRAGSSGVNVEVDFNLPKGAPNGYLPVLLTIAGISSNAALIPVGDRPIVNAVLNGASFKSPSVVAPGSIVSIFGLGFGPKDKLTTFPSTNVLGTSVIFGATAAPQFALASVEGQINVLVPYELPVGGNVDLTVVAPSGTSAVFPVSVVPSTPAMFFYTDPRLSTRRNAVALLPNSTWVSMPPAMGAAMGLPSDCTGIGRFSPCAQPAHVGDVVQFFVTGMGKATAGGTAAGKTLTTGSVAPASANPLYLTVDTPVVTIGGVAANVKFSGIAPGFSGLYQINVEIPAGIQTGDDVPVTVAMPGSAVDTATIAVVP
jgi:uncharacterized protein (TIGR03437 family)